MLLRKWKWNISRFLQTKQLCCLGLLHLIWIQKSLSWYAIYNIYLYQAKFSVTELPLPFQQTREEWQRNVHVHLCLGISTRFQQPNCTWIWHARTKKEIIEIKRKSLNPREIKFCGKINHFVTVLPPPYEKNVSTFLTPMKQRL